MKCEEPMKNLWMISGRESQALVTHSARLPNTGFVPIYLRVNSLKRIANRELSRSRASPISC